MNPQLIHQIALTLLPNIGDVLIKQLVSYCGGAEAVFNSSFHKLKKAPGVGELRARHIINADKEAIYKRAEEELEYIRQHNIKTAFYLEKHYPQRLLQCVDAPVLLYYKGDMELNPKRAISIVGTRNATPYGKEITRQLVEGLKPYDVTIVSGLAYGIDITAHRAALEHKLQNIGVVAHGLDIIYPAQHRSVAQKMEAHGGLITDFMTKARFDKENFPKRNRIVAGMVDVVIVVETKPKGGSVITADIANSYHRDVFAVPGDVGKPFSEGCHHLVRTHRASLLENADQLAELLGWKDEATNKRPQHQAPLFVELNNEEKELVAVLKSGITAIDEITVKVAQPSTQIAANLLSLELKGVVRALPGKHYELSASLTPI